MKVTVESTDEFRDIDGRYCRVWRGTDSKGQQLALVVYHVIFKPGSDMTEAIKDLRKEPMTGLEQTWACMKEDIGPREENKNG